MRIVAAMSGGVDSAVAAARMRDAGHDVVGVHLALRPAGQPIASGGRTHGCCTLDDVHDARRAADVIGIPFYVWDFSQRFDRDVVQDFVAEYAAGRTPNPCLRCNERIKFSALLDRAVALGFDAVATGHYARIRDGGQGRQLHRAVDQAKDQSYVLGVLDAEQLARACFPLGDCTKAQVRAEAAARGLGVADKPDSHDICFVGSGDARAWLAERLGEAPGPVVDSDGKFLARHRGAHGFTVGQRHGLGLARHTLDGRPRYVLEVQAATRTVVVGPADALAVREIVGSHARWCGPPPGEAVEALAQVRAHGTPVPATAWVEGDSVHVRLHEPVRGVAPGQSVVLYDGTRVVGSTTIERTTR